jgi:2,3-bisphosphoglycerate-dependent phosphoglycerate mutase
MSKLILLRHGQSQWNLENRFTGWVDIPLTDKGREEALAAGKRFKDIKIDHAFTSALVRAQESLTFALKGAEQTGVPIDQDKALNERMYGDLQGLNKAETAEKFGAEQVHIWRRSYDVPPPNGESLKDTAARTIPYYESNILPYLKKGVNVLVVAHGNSLRSIVMQVEHMTPEQILKTEIPTGEPIVYDLDKNGEVINKTILAG